MTTMAEIRPTHELDVVVIGAGQSGLALGYHLARRGLRFVLLDAGERVGDAWRRRWDSLQLITPCPYNDLPGMRFPAPDWSFPRKDEVADYLADYARAFALPVRLGHRVLSVEPAGERYRVDTPAALFVAPAVVVATGAFQRPALPGFARAGDLVQLHSSEYRNPRQIPPGDVLVVGCGNSGAGIAQDLAGSHRVHLSLGRTGHIPRQILGRDIFWWAHEVGLVDVTIASPQGQRMSRGPDALIGVKPGSLAERLGVILRPRVVDVDGDLVRFADDTRHRFHAIVWATGFRPDYAWLRVPVLDERGAPVHRRGITSAPGLCFLGLKWQHRIDSSLLGGVGRDARHLDRHIAAYLAGAAPDEDHRAPAARGLHV